MVFMGFPPGSRLKVSSLNVVRGRCEEMPRCRSLVMAPALRVRGWAGAGGQSEAPPVPWQSAEPVLSLLVPGS